MKSNPNSRRQTSEVGSTGSNTWNPGTLIIIGGREDKKGQRLILKEVARRVGSGKLVIASVASQEPEAQWARYRRAFTELGVQQLEHLHIEQRSEAIDPARAEMLADANAIFFTGGDQVKITTKIGGTPIFQRVRQLYEEEGGLIAGTSAGAAAMGETMLVAGSSDGSHKVESAFFMARGLGLIRDMVIDQHFAQRARIERLVAAVAENPSVLGIGIDEDTAVIVEQERCFTVVGSGAVYVADGHTVSYTNVAQNASDRTLCLFDVRLHVMSHDTQFDLQTRRPSRPA